MEQRPRRELAAPESLRDVVVRQIEDARQRDHLAVVVGQRLKCALEPGQSLRVTGH